MLVKKSFLRNRIALLLVMIFMVMSFIIPSVLTDYSDINGASHNTNEFHILDIQCMRDCILAFSHGGKSDGTSHDDTGAGNSAVFIKTSGGLALPDTVISVPRLRSGTFFVPASPGIRTLSSYLITSIYLKDGSK